MPTRNSESMQHLRDQKLARGQCSWSGCYKSASEGFRRCDLHREKERANSRARERKETPNDKARRKKKNAERIVKGLCIACGKNPVSENRQVRCRPCLDRRNATSLSHRRHKDPKVCSRCPELKIKGRSLCAYHLTEARFRVALRKTLLDGRRGYISKDFFWRLIEQQHRRCNTCFVNLDLVEIHIDHIVSLSQGGMHDESNLQLLCAQCNEAKGTKTQAEFVRSKRRLF